MSTPSSGRTAHHGGGRDGRIRYRAEGGDRKNARMLLQVDGGFEALLGALLVIGAATGVSLRLGLPNPPANRAVLVVLGLLFMVLCPLLWRFSRAPRLGLLQELAVANGASGLVLALWVVIWNRSFQTAGAGLVLLVAGVLIVMSVLYLLMARAYAAVSGSGGAGLG